MWVELNENPVSRRTIDCTVRAISTAMGQDWDTTFVGISVWAFDKKDMPTANHVWGSYLHSKGWSRHIIPNECPDCYTVADFCRDNPRGTFILAVEGHVVCVIDGNYIDTWDSGEEVPLYYWKKD